MSLVEIKRPETVHDGPADGVTGVTNCIRTDFIENPGENEAAFQQRGKSPSHVSASVKLGIFSIRDMDTGVMLTVSIEDAIEVMHEALEASSEIKRAENNEEHKS